MWRLTIVMLVWIILVGTIGLSAFFVLGPIVLGKSGQIVEVTVATRRDELKTALDAVDRDEAAGLIGPAEAERNRMSIANDYEAFVQKSDTSDQSVFSAHQSAPFVAVCASLLLAAVAATTYAFAGSPNYKDQPLAWRIANDPVVEIAHNVDRMENYLASNPEDGKAWALVAPIYFEYQTWGKAANAYLRAARYGDFDNLQKSRLLVMAARSMVSESDGEFIEPSAQIAVAAARYDRNNIQARFLEAQANEVLLPAPEVIAAWKRFIDDFEEDKSGLIPLAEERLEAATAFERGSSSTLQRGPSADQMEAAAQLSEEQQQAMVDGMVSRLAARLAEEPNNQDGWLRLIRSYVVLGEIEKANAALASARGHFSSEPEVLEQFALLARDLSLEP